MPPKSSKSSSVLSSVVGSKQPERMRNIAVTINNWSEEDIQTLESFPYKYMIIGREGSKTKTPHLQCYIQFHNALSFTSLKRKIGDGHIEHAKTKAETNIEYCKKEGNYKEYGTAKSSGKRTDLDEIRTLALDGGMRAVTRVGTQAQIRVAESFLTYNEVGRSWKPNVFYLHGPAGVGKSRLAQAILLNTTGVDPSDNTFILSPIPDDDIPDPYTKSDPSKWWNGYDGHPNVIIDDFRHSWWPLTYLLTLLDRYSFQIENKGGMRQFQARNIVITSINPPESAYRKTSSGSMVDSNGEPCEQLLRRIDEIVELDFVKDKKGEILKDKASYINQRMKTERLSDGRTKVSGTIDFADPVIPDDILI